MQQWQQWEDAADNRSPWLVVYGLVAGGATIGLCLLISVVQQNAGGLFTAGAAKIVVVTTLLGIVVAWWSGRR